MTRRFVTVWIANLMISMNASDRFLSTKKLRSMPENRRSEILKAGLKLAQRGDPDYVIEPKLMEAVSQERHLHRHVRETIKGLRKRRTVA